MEDPVFLPINPKVHALFLANSAVLGLAALIVALRVFARIHFASGLGLDDYCVLACIPVALAMLVITRYFSRLWVGQHVWDIPPSNYPLIHRLFLAYEILYVAILGLNKLSILSFYLRVFVQPSVRWWCKIFLVLLALGEMAMVVHTPLVCGIHSKDSNIKCIDLNISAIALGAWSLTTDIAVLALPIPTLMALQASRRRKVGLVIVFLILSAAVVSIVRVHTIVKGYKNGLEHKPDITFTTIWSDFLALLEPNVTTICISLPMLGPFVKPCVYRTRSQAASNCNSGRQSSSCSGRKRAHRGDGISMLELCREGAGHRADARSESGSETALAPPVE